MKIIDPRNKVSQEDIAFWIKKFSKELIPEQKEHKLYEELEIYLDPGRH